MRTILQYVFLSYLLIIICYYSVQVFNKISMVRFEGFANALASIIFLGVDLIFLLIFLLLKKYGGRHFLIYTFIFGVLFFVGVFLSNTYFWLGLVIVSSIISVINLLFLKKKDIGTPRGNL